MKLLELAKDIKSIVSPLLPTKYEETFFVKKLYMGEKTFWGKFMGECFTWGLMIRSCKVEI